MNDRKVTTMMLSILFLILASAATVTLAVDSPDEMHSYAPSLFADDVLVYQSCKVVQDHGQFVNFRLCQKGIESNIPPSCTYSEYVVTLEEYLSAVVPHQQKAQDEFCRRCKDVCKSDPKNQTCISCSDTCSNIKNMVDNGYIDAAEFSHCQMIYDPPEDDLDPLYAGPVCASNGSTINIGVFGDPGCTKPDASKQVENYLVDDSGYSLKLSYHLLRGVYGNDGISCSHDICQDLVASSASGCKNAAKGQSGDKVGCVTSMTTIQKTEQETAYGKWFGLVGALLGFVGVVILRRSKSNFKLQKKQFPTKGGMESEDRENYELVSVDEPFEANTLQCALQKERNRSDHDSTCTTDKDGGEV